MMSSIALPMPVTASRFGPGLTRSGHGRGRIGHLASVERLPLRWRTMTSICQPLPSARAVVPSAYRIFLTPDLDAATFAGRVEIDVDVTESTDTLTLNAVEPRSWAPATLTAAGASRRSGEPAPGRRRTRPPTFVFDERPAGGPGDRRDRLHRDPQRPARRASTARPSPTTPARSAHHRHDAVRGLRRPPGLPLLGRALLQGDLPGQPHRAEPPRRLLELPGHLATPTSATASAP